MSISVFIVDDDPLVLDSLQRILNDEPDLNVVGSATTAALAIQQVRELRPDVVLMDLHLNGPTDGVEATRKLKNSLNPPAVLAITSFDLDTYMRGALDAGATGFLLKADAKEHLANGIRMAHAGDPMISSAMTTRLIKSYLTPATDPRTEQAREKVAALSEREIQISTLIGEGKTYEAIAQELYISRSTVKSSVSNAARKIDATTGAQLATIVAQARLDLLN